MVTDTACSEYDEKPITAAAFAEGASVVIDTLDGANFSQIRAILPTPGNTVIVLDAHQPFLRVYNRRGEQLRVAGRKGAGPSELERPWMAALNAGRLWIGDGEQLAVWDVNSLAERRRLELPANALALLSGCGDELVVVYEGQPSSEATSPIGYFGLAILRAGTWQNPTELTPIAAPFTPTGPDFRAVAMPAGQVALFNHFHGRFELLACGGGETRGVPIPGSTDSRFPPRPQGMGWLDGRLVAFWAYTPEKEYDGTHVAIWAPGWSEVQERVITGDFRLHAVDDSTVWVVDNDIFPRILGFDRDQIWNHIGMPLPPAREAYIVSISAFKSTN